MGLKKERGHTESKGEDSVTDTGMTDKALEDMDRHGKFWATFIGGWAVGVWTMVLIQWICA